MNWQDLISLGVVLAALAYVVRHLLLVGTRKKPTGCGTCADCLARPRPDELLAIQPPSPGKR